MGNSNSQHHQNSMSQWTHSYPRPRHGQPQVKVLPEKLPPLQLRTTDNGAILQNGGTISCRKQSSDQVERHHRPRSSSAHRPPKPENFTLDRGRFGSEPDLRFHLKESRDQLSDNAVRQRISRSRKKYKAPLAPQNGSGVESSSPDLNRWESNGKECNANNCRKGRLFKTRAETSKKNLSGIKPLDKKDNEISRSTEALNYSLQPKYREEKFQQSGDRSEKKGLKRSASQEVISTKKSLANPEFQAELREAAQRLRPAIAKNSVNTILEKTNGSKVLKKDEVFTSLNIEIPKDSDYNSNKKVIKVDAEDVSQKCERRDSRADRSEREKVKNERDVPFKKFYFGMEESCNETNIVNNSSSTNNVDKTNAEHRLTAVEKSKNLMNLYKSSGETVQDWEDTVDKFAANFHKTKISMSNGNTTSCSSSFVSDPDEDMDGGIALQLRPTLPKKTLEIPRFSPTAAWRLLSSIDISTQAPSPGGSDESPFLLEDRIHAPVPQQGLRNNHDKSGDSGISGDASPGGCHESSSEIAAASPKPIPNHGPENILMAWTPQQDLEESSSDDLESPSNSPKNVVCQIPGARFSPRGQLFTPKEQSFSGSVLRDERMCLYNENVVIKNNADLPPRLNSLKKLKVTLGSTKRNDTLEDQIHPADDNWVLSRSVPSSINNSHIALARSASNPSSPEHDDEYGQQAPLTYSSYSYLANGGRIMYLPEYHSRMSPDVSGKKPRTDMGNGFLSKSCENISQLEMTQIRRSRSPSPVAIRVRNETESRSDLPKSNQKKKKFTFQSTVRLLENRRIAEKLSREAELKENQRLSELEAMKKVEEEFQKKRAREKANIRHQLRLFSLEEKNCNSLPGTDWEESQRDSERAPSSLPPPGQKNFSRKQSASKKPYPIDVNKFTPTTQVLSEYREPTRDYKDFRHSRHYESQEYLPENNRRSVVEHPRVVYDMPKNTAVYVSATINSSVQNQSKEDFRGGLLTPRSPSNDNYRKDFAHGALINPGRSLTSSDSELSQSHARPSSRQEFPSRRYTAALHRSRSVSSESLTPSISPPRSNEFKRSSRSRSVSPVRIVVCHDTNRNVNQNTKEQCQNEFTSIEKSSVSCQKNLERKSSNASGCKINISKCNESGNQVVKPSNGSESLLRFGMPSLKPFKKADKSFRPVNFNPVNNKLAQTVN